MISRELGVIRLALIDGIHAQHRILDQNGERPAGEQFAQWVRGQSNHVGISGVLDLDRLALDVKARMDAIDAQPDVQREAEWDALDLEATPGAQQSAEHEPSDPFPPPTPENSPERSRAEIRCQHCGMFIARVTTLVGNGWRHTGTMFLGCEPDHAMLAEP